MLIGVIANYNWRLTYRYNFENNESDIRFEDYVEEKVYDHLVVINFVENLSRINLKGNIYFLLQEPGHKILHRWMHKRFTKDSIVLGAISQSFAYLPWHVPCLGEQHLLDNKTKMVSAISSNKILLNGHVRRLELLEKLKAIISFDRFGKGNNFIQRKEEGLIPYRFSIAIENNTVNGYFTEKILDCFLCLSIPIYSGPKDILNYFPPDSIVNLSDVLKGNIILNEEEYIRRLPALLEARSLVMTKYNFSNGSWLSNDIKDNPRTLILEPNINRVDRIVIKLFRMFMKIFRFIQLKLV